MTSRGVFWRHYRRPLVAAIALHFLLLLLLSWQWSGGVKKTPLVSPATAVVSAALVELAVPQRAPAKAKKPDKKPALKAQKKTKAKVDKKKVAKKSLDANVKPVEKSQSQPSPVANSNAVVVDQSETVELPSARSVVEQALLADLAAEDAVQQASETAQLLAQYQRLIQQQMHRLWKLPPGAQRQMQVWLRIRLVPTGEVVAVEVVESSGNAAFDRSALLALEKLGRFAFIKQLPGPVFERHFRVLTFKFSAEELIR